MIWLSLLYAQIVGNTKVKRITYAKKHWPYLPKIDKYSQCHYVLGLPVLSRHTNFTGRETVVSVAVFSRS